MATETIFSNPIFIDFILPFLLVFTLVFAVLDKIKLLGEGKRQINAIISMVIGIILLSFPSARDMVVELMPFLVVVLVILFVFMLIYGFISEKKEGEFLGKGLKITLGILAGLAVAIAVLIVTGAWDFLFNQVSQGGLGGTIFTNVILIAVIGGAIAVVLSSGGKSDKK